ncbi:hypothetical protein CLV40_101544 [Actinokineospora auranticolor]|uniref:Uncharacterized protein n=1 Tax=Actinokineospora auranticolor TaxID=155976 RepID=A0A2S6H1M1_9PSEU|nr:hypothetical protein CLV40_101544 [Actinokineospora auranticolor]
MKAVRGRWLPAIVTGSEGAAVPGAGRNSRARWSGPSWPKSANPGPARVTRAIRAEISRFAITSTGIA